MTSNTNILTQRVSATAGSVRSISGFNRPSNIIAYTAGDVIFDTTSAGVIQFDEVGVAGSINAASCFMNEVDTADLELYIFDAEPTNIADNAAFALTPDDSGKLVAVYSFADTDKKNSGTSQIYEAASHDHASFTSTDGKLYGILVTRSAFTPASATAFALALHIEAN